LSESQRMMMMMMKS